MSNLARVFSGMVIGLWACGGGDAGGESTESVPVGDARADILAACESQQGIGWLKKQHGDTYCSCWADKAKEKLSAPNYATLVEAVRAELKAADKADREAIVREHSTIYSAVSTAAQACH